MGAIVYYGNNVSNRNVIRKYKSVKSLDRDISILTLHGCKESLKKYLGK